MDMGTLTGYWSLERNCYKNLDVIMVLRFKSPYLLDTRTEIIPNEIDVWSFASEEFRSGEVDG